MIVSHQVAGNQLTLLQNSAAYFPQLIIDMDAAQRSIYLETYIFAADQIGRRVSDALQRAAKRGVAVCVLLDGFGSEHFPLSWLDELRAAGVQVHLFRREIYRFKLRRHRLRRLHRKLVALDGEVAFIGGININDEVTGDNAIHAPRLDFAVRIEGSQAALIHALMQRLWSSVSWASSRLRGARFKRFIAQAEQGSLLPEISVLLRDNLRHRRDIERAYLRAIAGAQREVVIANAYFLPGRIFRRTMIQAARRGVRVVLLLQGRVEYRLQHYATQALYEQLLAAGVEIYEYQASFLHAKVAVVDGVWATVGSSNIDPFSLLLAREANLVVHNAAFAAELRGDLFAAITRDALRIEPVHWRRHKIGVRLVSRLCYALVRMMIGVLGNGKHSV